MLNNSNHPEINVGLSMGMTHYFENGVKKGEIVYRWPGAVHYTVYAVAREPYGINDLSAGLMTVSHGVPYCEMKRCYGGGSGTWLIVEGGPEVNGEQDIISTRLIMKVMDQETVFERGDFTAYSHSQYHSKPNLSCTRGCTECNE